MAKCSNTTTRAAGTVALLLTVAFLASGDAIRIQGEWLENVHIVEGAQLYFVLLPEDGRVINVRKDEVTADDIRLDPDASARAERRAAWSALDAANRSKRSAPTDDLLERVHELRNASTPPSLAGRHAFESTQTDANTPNDDRETILAQVTEPPRVTLRDVPLRTALRATLRPMNLDFRDMGGYLMVGSPRRLEHVAVEPLENRVYALNGDFGHTLPKVVLRNPSGALAGGGVASFQGAQGGFPPFAQRGFRGAGGFGGGGMDGFAGDVTVLSNISDLFGTIDDRLVGEAPASLPGLQFR